MVDIGGLCVRAYFLFYYRKSATYIFSAVKAAEMTNPSSAICQWPVVCYTSAGFT